MTENLPKSSLGERLRDLRRECGFRSQKDLADAIPGNKVTLATISDIESGRKVTVDISQLFNIAMALHVPPIYLLAPIRSPGAFIDLPNLSDSFTGMTAAEFDAWLSNVEGGAYRASTIEERNAAAEIHAARSLRALRSDIARYEAMLDLQESEHKDQRFTSSTEERLQAARADAARIETVLRTAGWSIT